MTKKECLEKVRDMYLWIADRCIETESLVYKGQYFAYGLPDCEHGKTPKFYCYACQYIRDLGLTCEDCPIEWGGTPHYSGKKCLAYGSPYEKYADIVRLGTDADYKEAAGYARQIADLAEKAIQKIENEERKKESIP